MFSALFRDLRSLSISNIEYFQNGKNKNHARFHKAFCLLHEHLDQGIQPSVEKITPRLQDFDLSPDVQANGFRSIINIIHKCCLHILQLSRYIHTSKESVFFRSFHYSHELDSYVETLGQLRACLEHSCTLMDYCFEGSLFADEDRIDDSVAEQLASQVEKLSQECFYGRTLGFQFCDTMRRPLQTVAVAMASFSESYKEKSHITQFASSVLSSGKYFMNPELRGKQVSAVTRTADVKFCKAFWSITENELMQTFPSLVCPTVKVNEVFNLEPEMFEMDVEGSTESVTITPPCAHSGTGAVKVRLISSELREGQASSLNKHPSSTPVLPMSPCLLVHCHGGGFVSQSSKSHEIYLRQWAKDLNVPILSIDYSLAPELPFPRAVEDCFYAYAWAVKNCNSLGSTGEVICFAGDSAGGNLMISTALRAASFGIRVPNGIMAAYTPVLVHYTPSPSRMLSLMDPLLPVGILVRCMAAYAGIPNDFLDQKRNDEEEFEVINVDDCIPDTPDLSMLTNSEYGSSVDGITFQKPEPYRVTPPYGQCTSASFDVVGDEHQTVPMTTESVDKRMMTSSVCHSIPSSDDEEAMDMETVDLTEDHTGEIIQPCPETISYPEGEVIQLCSETISDPVGEVTQPLGENESGPEGARVIQTFCEPDSGPEGLNIDDVFTDEENFSSTKSQLKLDLDSSKDSSEKTLSAESPSVMEDIGLESLNLGTKEKTEFKPLYARPKHQIQSPVHLFRTLPIVKNPYMSPMVAPDDMLSTLPPIYLVACHLDPLLDDSVMFAKKLRQLGNKADLHVVDDLPHGFLNFCTVSAEARRASDICVEKIRKVLHDSQF